MQTIGVVFNLTPKIEYYNCDCEVKVGDFCLVETSRGLEFARIVEVNSNEKTNYSIKRLASAKDISINQENIMLAKDLRKKIREIVEQHKLNMKICKCEFTFDKEKLIIHYTAEERVDFRELVKALANEFKTRIEMHQVNARDETQIMGAIGCCGRVCCCKNHLSDFAQISIKMAKKQNLSLNPQKLNGMCGKLMCCLKYENEFYEQIMCKMPKINSKVTTPDGVGVAKNIDCLKEMVEVQFIRGDETEKKTYNLSELSFEKGKEKDE